MLRLNFRLAFVLFFGWLLIDSIFSLVGHPLSGIYYPLASGILKSVPVDWTAKTWYAAPIYLTAFATLWVLLARMMRVARGSRASALITALVMAPFWIVSAVTMDMYDLELNRFWLASMIYANLSFLLYAFLGEGRPEDLGF